MSIGIFIAVQVLFWIGFYSGYEIRRQNEENSNG